MKPETTREKLIEAGAYLFAEIGYASTSVGQLEKAVGLTPRAGGFYRHFKSKEMLLLTLAEERFETPERLGLEHLFPLENTRAELVYIARAYAELNRSDGQLARVIFDEAARIPLLAEKIKQANIRLYDSLLSWLRSKSACRDLSDAEIGEFVYIVFGGWLFFLSRQDSHTDFNRPNSEKLINRWVSHWAPFLDCVELE